jgi:hypothetical protein
VVLPEEEEAMSSENSNPMRRFRLWLVIIFWTLTLLSAWAAWASDDPKFLIFTATMALSGLVVFRSARRQQ